MPTPEQNENDAIYLNTTDEDMDNSFRRRTAAMGQFLEWMNGFRSERSDEAKRQLELLSEEMGSDQSTYALDPTRFNVQAANDAMHNGGSQLGVDETKIVAESIGENVMQRRRSTDEEIDPVHALLEDMRSQEIADARQNVSDSLKRRSTD